jgi:ABC-type glucose/galactose transport system permease subunit
MMIDDKGKIKGKVSIVDIVVVLLILFLAAGIFYKFYFVEKGGYAEFDNLQYKVEVKGIRQQSVDAITLESKLFESETDVFMGTIIEKVVEPELDYLALNDGTMVQAEKPGRYIVTLTIDVDGVENDHGFFAQGSTELKIGSSVWLKNQLISFEGTVQKIKRGE